MSGRATRVFGPPAADEVEGADAAEGADWADGRSHHSRGDRVYRSLLRLLPSDMRREDGAAMMVAFRDWRLAEGSARGGTRTMRFWRIALGDLAATALRERWRSFGAGRRARPDPFPPPYASAAAAALAVWVLYLVTLAPSTAFWDASEYIAVAHILGIPHPPGNPLFVILARSWELMLAPLDLPVAVRVNLLSATASAIAHGLWFLVADRLLASGGASAGVRRVGAAAAVILSATAFTVWNQSNVNEKVYTLSLLTVAASAWLVLRWRDRGDPRLLVLAAYLLALSAGNHLMGVLAAPALVVFVALTAGRKAARPRGASIFVALGGAAVVGLSVHLFLPIRAEMRPLIAEAEPACESLGGALASIYTWGSAGCPALSSSLKREQYGKPSILSDPNDPRLPRSPDLLAHQVANYAQYLDWQWARSLAGENPIFGGARPLVTLLVLLLGALGIRSVLRTDPAGGWLLVCLFAVFSLGLVVYLNFRFGYSLGAERAPSTALREVRERDYFFLVGFSIWGIAAGLGLLRTWQWLTARFAPGARPRTAFVAPLLVVALVPGALNWSWASRTDDFTARDWAYTVLMSVEPYGILVTNGDNDTFPLWYLQEVEGIRRDVAVVVTPYLNTPWYAKQLRDLTMPCPAGRSAADAPSRIVCQRVFRAEEMPRALAAATPAPDRPPEDSILPLSDDEIESVARSAFVLREPLRLQAGALRAIIPEGTRMLPADTFVAAMVRANAGRRPVHFVAPSPVAERLGLLPYTIRRGLTFKADTAGRLARGDEHEATSGTPGLVALPRSPSLAVSGAGVDVHATDLILSDVSHMRGVLRNTGRPWADAATRNIALYYVWAHQSAAQAFALAGRGAESDRHLALAGAWERHLAD